MNAFSLYSLTRRTIALALALCALAALALLRAAPAFADPGVTLPVVAPVQSCEALAQTKLDAAVGAPVSIETRRVSTAQDEFCEVSGTIEPAIGFKLDLPASKWTQRYLQAGCGGLCGMINASIGNAGDCRPALDGEFAVAATDMGHTGRMGAPDEGAFAADPQKRIDFAYRANHLTALASKALMRAFYGVAPRYAYFSGCSDGGREALMEAQRYPDDFDGISAGAPAMLFQIQNSFFHAWTVAANRGSDGKPILLAPKLRVLHDAVIAHCDTLDGVKDGLLSDPRTCHVQQSWVACKPGASNTQQCLTPAEWSVAQKIYTGPTDAAGHRFLPGGLEPGSEMMWGSFVPRDANSGAHVMSAALFSGMVPVVNLVPSQAESSATTFPFTTEQFTRMQELHPLNDATNPDLRAFSAHGGKLIMWHGWADFSIAPMISIAYYRAVQAEMGAGATDRFLRLFMIPGVGHCGGGDGFAQVDTLSPLMNWVEHGTAPASLRAERIAASAGGFGGPPPASGAGMPHGAPPMDGQGPQGPQGGSDGRGGGMGAHAALPPVAIANQPALASRPIYPFPQIAHYLGKGDPASASSYGPAPSPAKEPAKIDWYGAFMLRPGFQKQYVVRDDQIFPLPQ
ncbi:MULTISPECIES: tannase/feruloyl esterase family alpha/beta hydrolase [unclassified Paraburkholderia]|uniref:tannase/feruloyl esterase family alpha/beta hydrolase n=1 Tax=unclassified Paraburkholderia TaxID=2615204 RepID=UPI002AB2DD44|nr:MULTISPECIES: tannase/feruloyl esterase family alpha/beta hydrolase [unclassified Paraburkholderia]